MAEQGIETPVKAPAATDAAPQTHGDPLPSSKLKGAMAGNGSSARKYFALTYGPVSMLRAILQEIVFSILGPWPGAAGIALRGFFYRPFFASMGRKALIGRSVTFRHSCKIRLGDNVVIDDYATVDAKGDGNEGVSIGDGSYVGRHTIIYCKGGSMRFGKSVSFSANCIAFSSNMLTIGDGVMIGAYSYILSGGEYDPYSDVPFAKQDGMRTRGPLSIGSNCWLGARVTVLDAAGTIGDHAVIAAGAVVTRPVAPDTLTAGIPARPLRPLRPL